MIFRAGGDYASYDPKARKVQLRCPACLKTGVLEPIGAHDVSPGSNTVLGQRRCPNPECSAHIFFIQQGAKLLASYPAERIDFDATDIPEGIVKSLEEAITCHAHECYMASALMARRALEELCRNRRAEGATLNNRLESLRSKVVLPEELLKALHNLRLLGNDAAHIESQTYTQVGKEEVEIGIEFTKEVLKAVYQYSGLLKRLDGLKKNQ